MHLIWNEVSLLVGLTPLQTSDQPDQELNVPNDETITATIMSKSNACINQQKNNSNSKPNIHRTPQFRTQGEGKRFQWISIIEVRYSVHTFSESQQYLISFSYGTDEGVTSNSASILLNFKITSSTFNTQ